MKDILIALNNKLKILNIATEPLKVKELYKKAFSLELDNSPPSEFKYDMRTKYAKFFGKKLDYVYNKTEILDDLKKFKEEYESVRI